MGRKAKFSWKTEIVHAFCDLCIREIERGNRPGRHLTKDGWANILNDFVDNNGEKYEKHQLSYKLKLLKNDWRQWKLILENESDVNWDWEKHTVSASDSWWDQKLKVFPEAKKFRDHGIEPELEQKLDKMFMIIGDLEEFASDADDLDKPKSRKKRKSDDNILKSEENILNSENILKYEDILECENMALVNTPKSNEPSKRGHLIEEINLEEKGKYNKLEILALVNTPKTNEPSKRRDLIDKINLNEKSQNLGINLEEKSNKYALVAQKDNILSPDLIETKSTATSIKQFENINYTITDAIRLLDSINEVPKLSQLYYFAIKLILDRDKREVFMALSPESKVWWLKMEESESRK